jgi:Spy/CpxP family protein refolding chaperone
MRTLIAATVLVLVALVCPRLWALDEAKDKEVGEGLAERIQDLNLTEDQEAKIAGIRKEYKPKVEEAVKELATVVKEEVAKISDVLTDDQKKKLKELKEERKEQRQECLSARIAHLKEVDLTEAEVGKIEEIRKEYRPKIVKAMKQLEGLLSDDQKKAREAGLKDGKKRTEIMASLKLTDDQKAKVVAVGKEVATIVREETEKIRDVLSEEQKSKLADLKDERKDRVRHRWAHRVANLKDLDLTDEQKNKIADIRKEFRPKVQEAGNKLRGMVREEVEAIIAAMKS